MSKFREDRREKAIERYEYNKRVYKNEIEESIKNSIITDKVKGTNIITNGAKIGLVGEGIVEAIMMFRDLNNLAVLNFASYKNPGGGFLGGAMAQEEILCHYSTLYNVIENKEFMSKYYEVNRKDLNRGMYRSKLIYSPNIIFEQNNNIKKCSVITCAAPNRGAALRNGATEKEIEYEMQKRLDMVLNIANIMGCRNIILGAFGCGVFKNKAEVVAKMFKQLIDTKYNKCFEHIIFAVPRDKNFEAFEKYFTLIK